jgi:hypothetical protein
LSWTLFAAVRCCSAPRSACVVLCFPARVLRHHQRHLSSAPRASV